MTARETLGSICSAIVDCEHKTAPIDDAGDFFAVGTPAMRGNVIDYSQARRISRATFDLWTRRLKPADGDLLFAREAPVGPIVRVPKRGIVAPGQRTVLLRPDSSKVDSNFLFYLLSSPTQQQLIAAKAAGSTVAHLNVADVRSFELPALPSIREQHAIAEVLGALDDKIAANATLVQAADALAATSLAKAVEAATQAAPLSSLAEFVNGKAFTKGATGTGRVVIRIAELNSGVGGSTVYNDIDVAEKHLARQGDLLFAWSGSLTVHRWHRPEGIVNQHIFKVIPNDGYPLWLVNGVLRRKLADYRAIAADKATTMGHIQRHHLDERVRIPSPEDVGRLDAAMSALWDRALAAEVESLKLAETRDALLPLLMSGKVRVKDAEKVVEGVV